LMRLVIDTSSIISALIKNGISRRIIVSPAIQFITPDHSLKEISKYKELRLTNNQILQKTGIQKDICSMKIGDFYVGNTVLSTLLF